MLPTYKLLMDLLVIEIGANVKKTTILMKSYEHISIFCFFC